VSSIPFVPSVVSRFTTEDTEGTKKTCEIPKCGDDSALGTRHLFYVRRFRDR